MIPDDEPWWMVRANTGLKLATEAAISNYRKGTMSGDRPLADKVCQGSVPNDIAMAAERQQAIKAEPASETLQALDTLPFRPIGYEW